MCPLSPRHGASLVADRGDGLQMWRVAANILNKQSRTADNGWSSSLGVGRVANNPPPERNSMFVTKHYTQPRTWTDSLDRWQAVVNAVMNLLVPTSRS
jgi:hypothetical protein